MNVKNLKILLADDDTDDCIFFEEALESSQQPAHLTAVHDGEQLMSLLNNQNYQLPDILFLDLNMPRKNGFECLGEIKQNEKLKELAVVIFSTSFEQEVVNQLYNNGAQYFIRKPSEFSQFRKIILHTILLIKKENFRLRSKENFVLTAETI